jgi:DNA-binding NarL/FixJ family response regulator
MNRPTVLIVEDDFLIREGALRPPLEPHFEIVAEVGDGLAAIAAAEQHRPDIILLDVSLPGMRGFEVARKILAHPRGCKILFVSNYADRDYVERAKQIGANGYVLKSRAPAELLNAIRAALAGRFYWPDFYTQASNDILPIVEKPRLIKIGKR